MTTLVIHPAARPLGGSVPVQGDPEIALHALALAAIARGPSRLSGVPASPALDALVESLRALGVAIDRATPSVLDVEGVGRRGLVAPKKPLDAAESRTVVALLVGILAGRHFTTSLTGASGLARLDFTPLVAPLRLRGARIAGSGSPGEPALRLPLTIGPLAEGRALSPLEHASDEPDALLKTALLLSGLDADGPTLFREPSVSADHTERMLGALEAPVQTSGPLVRVDPKGADGAEVDWRPFSITIPGDPIATAYVLAAIQVVPGSRATVRGVSTNPTTAGFLALARELGAGLAVSPRGEALGEPFADVEAWHAEPRAALLGGEPLQRTGGAWPAAVAIAAVSHGTSRLRPGPGDLETLAVLVPALSAFGLACSAGPEGVVTLQGKPSPLDAADVDAQDDPHVAMAASVLALGARGPCRVRRAGAIATRFPKFVATLRALGATVEVRAE